MRWRGGRFFSYFLIRRSPYLSHGVTDTEAERCGVEGCENLVNEWRLSTCVRCSYLFGEVEEVDELQALHVKFLLLNYKNLSKPERLLNGAFFTAMERISGTVILGV